MTEDNKKCNHTAGLHLLWVCVCAWCRVSGGDKCSNRPGRNFFWPTDVQFVHSGCADYHILAYLCCVHPYKI